MEGDISKGWKDEAWWTQFNALHPSPSFLSLGSPSMKICPWFLLPVLGPGAPYNAIVWAVPKDAEESDISSIMRSTSHTRAATYTFSLSILMWQHVSVRVLISWYIFFSSIPILGLRSNRQSLPKIGNRKREKDIIGYAQHGRRPGEASMLRALTQLSWRDCTATILHLYLIFNWSGGTVSSCPSCGSSVNWACPLLQSLSILMPSSLRTHDVMMRLFQHVGKASAKRTCCGQFIMLSCNVCIHHQGCSLIVRWWIRNITW